MELYMGEVSQISEMANNVSKELFAWFKWEVFPLIDQNFPCSKVPRHAPDKDEHTHPVDIVFRYIDPYTGVKTVFNTDLKSYKTGSISKTMLRDSLKSLAKTIDCARISRSWKERYNAQNELIDLRGMLFVYNHDGEYDKEFYELFKPTKIDITEKRGISLDSVPLQKNQQIHLVEPKLINCMTTIINDASMLHS
jgi:hypothetical protein